MPETKLTKIPCCPSFTEDDACDVMKLEYSLTHMAKEIPVEVTYQIEVRRCTSGLALGNLLHTITLLPGEKVRLATRDRTSRFSLESETDVSTYSQFSSEEQAFMSTFSRRATDYDAEREVHSESDVDNVVTGSGSVSGPIETFLFGGSAKASGTFDGHSSSNFMEQLRTHLESTHDASAEVSKTRQSTSIAEVSVRSRVEGESESHEEASSRVFENRNECHALTYMFYQVNKVQEVSIEVSSITRKLLDPASDTKLNVTPIRRRLGVADIEPITAARPVMTTAHMAAMPRPLPVDKRTEALKMVDDDLISNKLAVRDQKTGGLAPSTQLKTRLKFSRQSALPTPGIIVRACLDECEACEPLRQEKLKAELEHKQLANELLKKQIELLEKHADYRCCPEEHSAETDTVTS